MFRKSLWKHGILCALILMFAFYFGLFTHLYELDYYTRFRYPLDIDLPPVIEQLKHNVIDPARPPPINDCNYDYLLNCEKKCANDNGIMDVRLVLLVRSSPENIMQRMAIRNSWGFESRFSDVTIKTIFIIGITRDDTDLQERIVMESRKYNDLVQVTLIDNFYNNTMKTIMALKWAKHFCPKSKFYMVTNDNVYVSTKNVLYFIRNPANYPDYIHDRFIAIQRLARQKRNIQNISQNSGHLNESLREREKNNRTKRQIEYELADDVLLYAGYVYVSSPHRHKSSKWYVSLEEYPYHMWPRYIIGDAFILSKEALLTLYYGSLYTKHLKFDDIYLGIVAKKAGLLPFHCEEIHFQKKQYSNYNYKYVIASSGYDNVDDMLRVWSEQKEMGHA